jgi:hypothetical protein
VPSWPVLGCTLPRAAARLNHKVSSFHILYRLTSGTRCVCRREQVCRCDDHPCDVELRFAGRMVRPLINSDCDDHFVQACALDVVFSGEFAKLRKATISFVMSVCVSVRSYEIILLQLDRFSLNLIFIFRKCVEKIEVSLKSAEINGHFYMATIANL